MWPPLFLLLGWSTAFTVTLSVLAYFSQWSLGSPTPRLQEGRLPEAVDPISNRPQGSRLVAVEYALFLINASVFIKIQLERKNKPGEELSEA